MKLSVIIPALNEEALIARTLRSVEVASERLTVEVIVVDNGSRDRTQSEAYRAASASTRIVECKDPGAASARNCGVDHASGDVLVFLDADTLIGSDALQVTERLVTGRGYAVGMAWLFPREPGVRSAMWWSFWNRVRALPLARAKAMSALMFCTRAAFVKHGPFDVSVDIGEEWPILAGAYRADPNRFYYGRDLVAFTSSRRMELQSFGYARTLLQYAAAICLSAARRGRYTVDLRGAVVETEEGT